MALAALLVYCYLTLSDIWSTEQIFFKVSEMYVVKIRAGNGASDGHFLPLQKVFCVAVRRCFISSEYLRCCYPRSRDAVLV